MFKYLLLISLIAAGTFAQDSYSEEVGGLYNDSNTTNTTLAPNTTSTSTPEPEPPHPPHPPPKGPPKGGKDGFPGGTAGEVSVGLLGTGLICGVLAGGAWHMHKRWKRKQEMATAIPVYHVVNVGEHTALLNADAPPKYAEGGNGAMDEPPTYKGMN